MTLQEVLQDVQKAAEAVKLSIEAKIEDDQIICDGVYLSETQVAKKNIAVSKIRSWLRRFCRALYAVL